MTLPDWAKQDIIGRHAEYTSDWEAEESERFSRVVHIAYPNQVHFVVQKLEREGWVYTEPLPPTMYWSQALAEAAAQKKAYMTQQPHRVLEVVWRG